MNGPQNMNAQQKTLSARQLRESLELEIHNLSRQIYDLTQQRDALQRMLKRSRDQDDALSRTEVTRKNSINRVVAEGSLLRYLHGAKGPVQTKKLFRAACSATPGLNENTFRSHLHRMKERGLVESPNRGTWQATAQSKV